MGQGCSSCSVGNPCTDPECYRLGSKELRGLVNDIRQRYADLQDGVRNDERNETWLQKFDRKFLERTTLSPEGFKYHANNIKNYFSAPQPTIDGLENVEYRLLVCLDAHKEGEYLECQNNAHELMELATAGRDPPAHCKSKPNPYKCAYGSPDAKLGTGLDADYSGPPSRESQPFGSCYA